MDEYHLGIKSLGVYRGLEWFVLWPCRLSVRYPSADLSHPPQRSHRNECIPKGYRAVDMVQPRVTIRLIFRIFRDRSAEESSNPNYHDSNDDAT